MSSRYRPENSGGPFYRPDRDLAYLGSRTLQMAARYINKEFWPVLTVMTAKLMGVDGDEAFNAIVSAHEVFHKYLATCCEDSKETPRDVLNRVGWQDVPEPARAAYYTILGILFSTKLFSALRDEHQEGAKASIDKMAAMAFQDAAADFNQQNTSEAAARALRLHVRECRRLGLKYDEILQAVNLERIGGVMT